jgi:hypothetical protein
MRTQSHSKNDHRNERRYPLLSQRRSARKTRSAAHSRPGRVLTEDEGWKLDESWTTILAYVAGMTLPGEG